jgi:hypothetical protein
VYTVKNKNGGAPTATQVKDNDWAIYRAYTSLSNWQSQTENPIITEPVENDVNPSKDLVTTNTIMMVACYNDSAMNDGNIQIDGWTTSATKYIRIYTPTSSSEVGFSQRHYGIAKTGFRLAPTVDAGDDSYAVLRIMDEYVRIEGVEIDGTNVTNAHWMIGIRLEPSLTATAEPRLDKLIIHDLKTSMEALKGILLAYWCRKEVQKSATQLSTIWTGTTIMAPPKPRVFAGKPVRERATSTMSPSMM